MSKKAQDRFESCTAFINALCGKIKIAAPAPQAVKQTLQERANNKAVKVTAVAAGVLLLIMVGIILIKSFNTSSQENVQAYPPVVESTSQLSSQPTSPPPSQPTFQPPQKAETPSGSQVVEETVTGVPLKPVKRKISLGASLIL